MDELKYCSNLSDEEYSSLWEDYEDPNYFKWLLSSIQQFLGVQKWSLIWRYVKNRLK